MDGGLWPFVLMMYIAEHAIPVAGVLFLALYLITVAINRLRNNR